MVLITSAWCEGSDEPACTNDLVRALASRINKICKLKKTPNNFKTSSLSGHARSSDYKRLLDQISCLYALFSWSRYLTLVPLNSKSRFIIIVSGLKIKPVLTYRQNLKKVQIYPPQKLSQHIHPGKWNAAGPQQHTKEKRLPGMLTYKVGHPCRLRFSRLHE